MELLIVTGFSGAGKSSAAAALEDMGYFCVDNMPPLLLPRLLELCLASHERYQKVAFVCDVRSGDDLILLPPLIDELRGEDCAMKVIFLEAEAHIIIKRYKETRHHHPLDPAGSDLKAAIEQEGALLAPLREKADILLNTSSMNTYQLQMALFRALSGSGRPPAAVTVLSFGYKHGIPEESDFVFDVRFLPNPFYVPRLRDLTGQDSEVYEYVFSDGAAEAFVRSVVEMLESVLPRFLDEGKSNIVLSVGCTGGHHRSVSVARRIAELLSERGTRAAVRHRDVNH